MLAWLPTLLTDLGMDLAEAATAFFAFAFLTLPMALITALPATKLHNVLPLAVILGLVYPIGYLGLILVPGTPLLWTFIMGLGGGALSPAITMFNLRTRTAAGSAALGGFAMGVGCLFGTIGPLLGGALFSATENWSGPDRLHGHRGRDDAGFGGDDEARSVPPRQV